MFFIDGENIVSRYQRIKEKGRKPLPHVIHHPDEFVWTPKLEIPGGCEVIRAFYYTSITGDDNKILKTIDSIRQIPIGNSANTVYGSSRFLYPNVFKKPRKSVKAKSVDIQMAVDVLTHTYQNNLDTICLFSGDGDYRSLIDEVIRKGKRVFVAAFSDGLSPLLQHAVDEVIELDSFFFG